MATSGKSFFTHTHADLIAVRDELSCREPIFHTPAFGTSCQDYETAVAQDYWEVGASGRRYSRAFILEHLDSKKPMYATDAGWIAFDHAVRSLGPNTFLLTYTLQQEERLTRRSTIWERTDGQWRVLYHQGTIVAASEDDVVL